MFWLRFPQDICGSKIGMKGKMCICPRASCPIANHKTVDRDEGLYLTTCVESQVWEDSHAPTGNIGGEAKLKVKELMGTSMPRVDWMAAIKAINDVHNSTTTRGRATAQEYLETLLEAFVDRYAEGGLSGTDLGASEEKQLSPMPKKVRPKKEFDLDEVKSNTLDALKKEIKQDIGTLDEHIHSLSVDMRKVDAAHGIPGEGQRSTWHTITDILATQDEAKLELDALGTLVNANEQRSTLNLQSVSHLNRAVNGLNQLVTNINDDLDDMIGDDKWTGGVEKQLRDAVGHLEKLDTRLTALNQQVINGGNTSQSRRVIGGNRNDAQIDRRLVVLEQLNLDARLTGLEAAPVGSNSSLARDLADSKAALEARLVALESAPGQTANDSRFEVDRWEFEGDAGVNKFVHENGIPEGADDFTMEVATMTNDVFQLLEAASEYGATAKSTFAAEEVHATKVGRPPSETALAAAMQSMVPACLTTSGSYEMTKIKTYSQFDAGNSVDGVAPRLLTALRELRKSETVKINDELRSLPALRELATYMLNATIDFLNELLQWAGNYYRSLVNNTGASTEAEKGSCWKLTVSMLYTICEVLWETRRPAKHAHTYSPRKKLVTYLTASLRTQVIMAEFKRTNFSEHPRIFPKLMNFIFESHTPKIEFVALKQSVKSATDQVATLKRNQDSILSRLKAVERQVGLGGGAGGGGGAGAGGNRNRRDD